MSEYTWTYIQKYPQETQRLLGINYEQLQQLIAQGKVLHRRKKEQLEKKKVRLIRAGGGNHPKLSEEEQIILTLVYLRHHLSFQLLGLLFQVSESTAHNSFTYWQQLFQEGLPPSLLEQLKKCPESSPEIYEKLIEYELIVDSSEQPIERPSDYHEQKRYYSGKQKRHTFKNQFIVFPGGKEIVDVVLGKPGPMSDIEVCRQVLPQFSEKQVFRADKAYLGEPQIITPVKKPKKGELTLEQKKENEALSSERVFVEHLIRVVKIFKISSERFRLGKNRYSSVLSTICGLVRLRLGSLVLKVIKSVESGKIIEVVTSHSFVAQFDFNA